MGKEYSTEQKIVIPTRQQGDSSPPGPLSRTVMMHFELLAAAGSTINNLNMSAEVVPTHRMAFAYPIWRHHAQGSPWT
jgi:hypothetical protein